jgi:hypothetical protein
MAMGVSFVPSVQGKRYGPPLSAPPLRKHNDDLHTRPESGRTGCPLPGRPVPRVRQAAFLQLHQAAPPPPILALSKTSLLFHPSDANKKIVHHQSRLLMENTADPSAFQDSTYGA